MFSNQPSRLTIKSLDLIPLGTYDEQYIRPFETNVTGATLQAVTNNVKQNNGVVSASSISSLSSDFMRPTSSVERVAGIANGWNQRRLRFRVVAGYDDGFGSEKNIIVTGYTDHDGIIATPTGQTIDPNMVFYVNNINTLTTLQKPIPGGQVTQSYRNVGYDQVLCNQQFQSILQSNDTLNLIRPSDVYGNMSFDHIKNIDYITARGGVYNHGSVLSNMSTFNSRENNNPATYLNRTLKGYLTASQAADIGEDTMGVVTEARGYTMDNDVVKNEFMSAIALMSTGNINRNSFKMSDLRKIEPNIDQITNYFGGENRSYQMAQVGQFMPWGGNDGVTVSMVTLAQSVPSIMSSLMIPYIAFEASNASGGLEVRIASGKCLDKANEISKFETFKMRLIQEVLKGLTQNNQLNFFTQMVVDIYGETRITLNIANSGVYTAVSPTFADSLFPPVITSNKNRADNITSDIRQVVEVAAEAVHEMKSEVVASPQANFSASPFGGFNSF